MPGLTPFAGSRLLSRAEFQKRKAGFWLLSGLWLAALFAVLFWLPIGGVARVALLLLLAVLAPAVSDLFEGYATYHRRWLDYNDDSDGNGPSEVGSG